MCALPDLNLCNKLKLKDTMNSAASLYQRANYVQRRDAEQILDEYSHVLQWRLDGEDMLMDVGCGSGDVTVDFLKPLMPQNSKNLIGIDISKEMIRHASKTYENSNVSFEVMDIAGELTEKFRNQFDHVTSFYCLHWVQNQKKAMENILELLRDDGDCLLVFLATCPVYDIFKLLSNKPQYSNYMKDVDKFIAPLHYSANPVDEFSKLMASVGFIDYNVEIRDSQFIYDSIEILKKNAKAINPFVNRMPTNLQDQFLDDYVKIVMEMDLSIPIDDSNDYRFISPYKLVIAYARK